MSATLKVLNATKEVAKYKVANGKQLIIQAQEKVNYQLIDDATGHGPQNIIAKRDGKDLVITLEDGNLTPDIIIKGYYGENTSETTNLLVGLHEDGKIYAYIPESGQTAEAVSMLAEQVSAPQALGGKALAGGALWAFSPWWLAALIPVVALAAAGGGGGGKGGKGGDAAPAPEHVPSKPELTKNPNGSVGVKVPANAKPGDKVIVEVTDPSGQEIPVELTKQPDGSWVSNNPAIVPNIPKGQDTAIIPADKIKEGSPVTGRSENPAGKGNPADPVNTPEHVPSKPVLVANPDGTVDVTVPADAKPNDKVVVKVPTPAGEVPVELVKQPDGSWKSNNPGIVPNIPKGQDTAKIPADKVEDGVPVTAESQNPAGKGAPADPVNTPEHVPSKPVLVANPDGTVDVTVPADAKPNDKVVVKVPTPAGEVPVELVKQPDGSWKSNNPGIVPNIPKGQDTAKIPADKVEDGVPVTAESQNPAGKGAPADPVNTPEHVPSKPVLVANPDGTVDVTVPADAKPNDKVVVKVPTPAGEVPVELVKQPDGSWKSNNPGIVPNIPKGQDTAKIPADKVEDGVPVTAESQNPAGKGAPADPVNTPEHVPSKPVLVANPDGTVDVTVPADAKPNDKVVVKVPTPAGEVPVELVKQPDGSWKSNNPGIVPNIPKGQDTAKIPADKVEDGVPVKAESQNPAGKGAPADPVKTPEHVPSKPVLVANPDGTVDVTVPADAKPNDKVVVKVPTPAGEVPVELVKQPDGSWKSNNPGIVPNIPKGQDTAKIPADKVEDGVPVKAESQNPAGKGAPADPVKTPEHVPSKPVLVANPDGTVDVTVPADAKPNDKVVVKVPTPAGEVPVELVKQPDGSWKSNNPGIVPNIPKGQDTAKIPADKVEDGVPVKAESQNPAGKGAPADPVTPPAGEKPTSPAGDKPTSPAGEKPTSPAGDKPTSPAGEKPTSPAGDKPTSPAGEKPTPPAGDKPTPPAGDKPTSPAGNKPTPPAGEKPTPPAGDKPTPPAGNKPTPPAGEKPTPPAGDKPTSPAGNKPTPPAGEKPTPPAGDKPTSPAGNKPTPPAGNKPTPPAGEKPTPSAGEKPTPPAGDKPTPPAGDKPTSPAGNKPTPPAGEKPTSPAGNKPTPPAGEKPTPPAGNKPTPPAGEKPTPPAGEKPTSPAGVKPLQPTPPAGNKPTPPAGEKPTPPAGEKPTPPAGNKPTPPAGEKPTPPAGEKPTSPAGVKPLQPTPPAGNKPTPPAGEKPTSPAGNKPTPPAGEKPTPPAGEKPTLPAGEKPAQPAKPADPAPTNPTLTPKNDGSVDLTPPKDNTVEIGDKFTVKVVPPTSPVNGTPVEVVFTKTPNGWTSDKPNVIGNITGNNKVNIPADKIKDGSDVTAKSHDKGNPLTDSREPATAKAGDPAPTNPKLKANPDGSVDLTAPAANDKTVEVGDKFTVKVVPPTSPVNGTPIDVVFTKEPNGSWTSDKPNVIGNIPANNLTVKIPADKIKDGSTVTAKSHDKGNPLTDNREPVKAKVDDPAPAQPALAINKDNTVTVTVPLVDVKGRPTEPGDKVTLKVPQPGGKTTETVVLTKQPDGSWRSDKPAIVPNVAKGKNTTTIPANKVNVEGVISAKSSDAKNPNNPEVTKSKTPKPTAVISKVTDKSPADYNPDEFEITGQTLPNAKVVVKDKAGNVLGETTANAKGAYTIKVAEKPGVNSDMKKGDQFTVVATAPSKEASDPKSSDNIAQTRISDQITIKAVDTSNPADNNPEKVTVSIATEAGAEVEIRKGNVVIHKGKATGKVYTAEISDKQGLDIRSGDQLVVSAKLPNKIVSGNVTVTVPEVPAGSAGHIGDPNNPPPPVVTASKVPGDGSVAINLPTNAQGVKPGDKVTINYKAENGENKVAVFSKQPNNSWKKESGDADLLLAGEKVTIPENSVKDGEMVVAKTTDLVGRNSADSQDRAGEDELPLPLLTARLEADTGPSGQFGRYKKPEHDTDKVTKNPKIIVDGIPAGAAWEYNHSGKWIDGTGNSFTLPQNNLQTGQKHSIMVRVKGDSRPEEALNKLVATYDHVAPNGSFGFNPLVNSKVGTGSTEPGALVAYTGHSIRGVGKPHSFADRDGSYKINMGVDLKKASGIQFKFVDKAGNETKRDLEIKDAIVEKGIYGQGDGKGVTMIQVSGGGVGNGGYVNSKLSNQADMLILDGNQTETDSRHKVPGKAWHNDIQGNAHLNFKGGDDYIFINGVVQNPAKVDLGDGNDFMSIAGITRGGLTGWIHGGNGDDILELREPVARQAGARPLKIYANANGFQVDMGAGNDTIILSGNNKSLRNNVGTKFEGGAGYDSIVFTGTGNDIGKTMAQGNDNASSSKEIKGFERIDLGKNNILNISTEFLSLNKGKQVADNGKVSYNALLVDGAGSVRIDTTGANRSANPTDKKVLVDGKEHRIYDVHHNGHHYEMWIDTRTHVDIA